MTKSKIAIYDCETTEIIVREMNLEETNQADFDKLQNAAEATQIEQAKADKAAAQAKLAALGLTTDDLKALGLGGN